MKNTLDKYSIKELLGLDFLHLDQVSQMMYGVMTRRIENDRWGAPLTKAEAKSLKELNGLSVIGKGKGTSVARLAGEIHVIKLIDGKVYPMCLYGPEESRVGQVLQEEAPF
jgi:hypothetical protein